MYGDLTIQQEFVPTTVLDDWIEAARCPRKWPLEQGSGNDVIVEELVIVFEWFEEA